MNFQKIIAPILLLASVLIIRPISSVYAWPVPNTGVTKCYDNDSEIPCPSPGERFYGYDSNYIINPVSYTKLGAGDNALSDATESWEMVRDNITGLIWENKHNSDSVQNYTNPQ